MASTVALFAALWGGLGGCSVGPAYKGPEIKVPTQWQESAGSAADSVWPAADWWRGFGSPQLDSLIAEAQRSNDDLAGAVARVQEADAQVRIAGAALLPSLDAGFTATRERGAISGAGPRVFNVFSAELTASYELDFWGKNRALRAAARAAAVASRYDQQTVALTVISSVARAALFPSIQLTAGGGYESSALTSLVSPPNRVYSVSAGLLQPIFHGGVLRGQGAYSKARYTELLTTYHKTVLTAFSNVEGALVAAQQTAEQRKRQQDAVATAHRAFEFAQQQMSAGTVNILTVLGTENALFSAQDQLVQVNYLHLQSLVDLFTALGGGWQQG